MTTPAITTLRDTLKTALTNTGVWQIFGYVPSNVIADSVIIQPDDPYIVPNNNQWVTIEPTVRYKIVAVVAYRDNQGNLNQLEDYAVQIFNKLSVTNLPIVVGSVSAPIVVEGSNLLMCEIPITVLSSWG